MNPVGMVSFFSPAHEFNPVIPKGISCCSGKRLFSINSKTRLPTVEAFRREFFAVTNQDTQLKGSARLRNSISN